MAGGTLRGHGDATGGTLGGHRDPSGGELRGGPRYVTLLGHGGRVRRAGRGRAAEGSLEGGGAEGGAAAGDGFQEGVQLPWVKMVRFLVQTACTAVKYSVPKEPAYLTLESM